MPLKIEIDIAEAKEMIAAQASIKYDLDCKPTNFEVTDDQGDEFTQVFFKAVARKRVSQTGPYDRT
jgi:hypothetical protein